MDKFKRILAVFMAVIFLSVTVGSDYLDTTHMAHVEATAGVAVAGISAATLFQICLFIGSAFALTWAVGKVIDNQEEIAYAGKKFIDSVKEIPEGFIAKITDVTSGQDYVFGSEAFELVRDTPWEVIQGGAPGNNNNDNNNDDDKKGWINLFSSANQYVGNFLALGSTWFLSHASNLYQKWVNGEEMTEAELAAIEPLVSGYCNQYDVAAQWGGTPFAYSVTSSAAFNDGRIEIYSLSSLYSFPLAGYLNMSYAADNSYSFHVFERVNAGVSTYSLEGTRTVKSSSGTNSWDASGYFGFTKCKSFSYNANFPVFASRIDMENYLLGRGDVTNALNYAKTYQVADWLSDDWAGQLIDPFTNIGLTLSQLIELMKALGLHAAGNNLSPEELADLIRKSLPDVNPDLLPDETPVTIPDPAPGTEPVYYPSPDAHPLPVKPTPDPNPGVDPDPEPEPEPGEDINPDTIVDDLSGDFSGIGDTLKRKFPFCIPWDMYYLLSGLAGTPKTPVYYLPLVIERWGVNEIIVVDMSGFEDISKLSRALLSLLWAFLLMKLSFFVVSVIQED